MIPICTVISVYLSSPLSLVRYLSTSHHPFHLWDICLPLSPLSLVRYLSTFITPFTREISVYLYHPFHLWDICLPVSPLSLVRYRVVNLPGNKSISHGIGKYWELPGNTGNYREIGNRWAHNCGWQILWPGVWTRVNYTQLAVEYLFTKQILLQTTHPTNNSRQPSKAMLLDHEFVCQW